MNRKRDGTYAPGVSGNPKGRPKLPPEIKSRIRASLKTSQWEMEQIIDVCLHLSRAELTKMLNDPETQTVVGMVAAIILKAMKQGDPTRMNAILGRRIGNVKSIIELTGHDGGPLQTQDVPLTEEELRTRLEANLAKLKILE